MKKIFITLSLFAIMVMLSVSAFATESAEQAPVSHGLNIIAAKMPMAKAGLVNSELYFSADDFERAMNFSKITSITIEKLPDVRDGELKLGSVTVKEGQTISRSSIDKLSFVSKDFALKQSSFEFSVDNNPYSTVCDVHFLTYVNHTPTLKMASEISLNVSTHRNITYFGKLSAYDPEGDDVALEIVRYPENGVLVLDNAASGEYRYIPSAGYVGVDSFTYVAKDCYGNYSASANVNIEVKKSQTSVVYRDIANTRYENAALTMTERSIMSGTQVGSDWYFYPDQSVSRVEFLVMAMNSIGITSVPDESQTVFSDDEDIPYSMKGYVNAAYELGYVTGEYDSDGKLCFSPNREITRAEAAVMLNSMLDLATPTNTDTLRNDTDVPAWAIDAIYTLNSAGILPSGAMTGGNASKTMSRAETALVLSCAVQVAEK